MIINLQLVLQKKNKFNLAILKDRFNRTRVGVFAFACWRTSLHYVRQLGLKKSSYEN